MKKFSLIAAGLHGVTAVSLGAFGAHGLKTALLSYPPEEAAKMLGWMETASRYQLTHAAALVGLAALAPSLPKDWGRFAAWGFTFGAAVFSGTLYAMALGAPHWLGGVTPIGGLGMLFGWSALVWAGLQQRD
jgi:uncharacterized membrane protein YgdD (TMEM256/DUF423 family)